jgi:hypothetical protein
LPGKGRCSEEEDVAGNEDEHFYELQHFNYHWPLHGLFLNDATLQKPYNGNSRKILAQYKKTK